LPNTPLFLKIIKTVLPILYPNEAYFSTAAIKYNVNNFDVRIKSILSLKFLLGYRALYDGTRRTYKRTRPDLKTNSSLGFAT